MIILCFPYHLDIIAAPVARVAVLNSDAIFSCDGTGFTLLWCIDGLQDNNIAIVDRGIDVDTISDPVARTWNSTLTVPATQENNKTVIQCEVVGSNGHKESPNVTLLIQGILQQDCPIHMQYILCFWTGCMHACSNTSR